MNITGKLVAGGILNYFPKPDKKGEYDVYFSHFGFTIDPQEVKSLGLSAEMLGSITQEVEKMDIEKVLNDAHFRANQGWHNYGIEVKCPENPMVNASLVPQNNGITWSTNNFIVSFFIRTEAGEMAVPEREVAKSEVPVQDIDMKAKTPELEVKEVKAESISEGKMKELAMEAGEADGDYDVDSFKAIEKALAKKGIKATHKEFDKYQGVYMILSKGEKSAKFWHVETFVTGKTKAPKGKFKDAYMIDDEGGKYSADAGDYFMQPEKYVFKGSTLVLIAHDGSKKEIENPKKSDLPKFGEVSRGIEFEGTPDDVMVFNLEGDEFPVEVRFTDGKPDVSELAAAFGALSEGWSYESQSMSESIDLFGMPILK